MLAVGAPGTHGGLALQAAARSRAASSKFVGRCFHLSAAIAAGKPGRSPTGSVRRASNNNQPSVTLSRDVNGSRHTDHYAFAPYREQRGAGNQMQNHSIGWIAVMAVIVGATVRALKSGASQSLLAALGLPPIPTRALPWLALALGGLAATLDAVTLGASWDAAAQAGVMAAAAAVFGHELLSGVPGAKKLLGILVLLVPLSVATSSCSLFTKKNANSAIDAITIGCVMSSTLTDESAVADVCDVAHDLLPILRDLIGQREAAKRAGVSWGGHPYRDAGADGAP